MGFTDRDIFHDLSLNFELIDGYKQESMRYSYTNSKFYLEDRWIIRYAIEKFLAGINSHMQPEAEGKLHETQKKLQR